ncbi:FAD-dependent oxidoreductase [Diplocloster hominis]|uniref:FAD-dependent oxidoreductase n=1 Tax=Diplocloster hominis TaxID=3079010 RepID=UPI0031BA7F0C
MNDSSTYEDTYPHLFAPMTIRGKTFKNRIITAPSNHGHITDSYTHQLNMEGVLYYGGKARGGAAMVTLGEALLDHGNSSAHASHVDLTSESCLPSLHRLTDYVHMHNSLVSIELNHNGHFALPRYCNGEMPMAASAMDMPDGTHVREMNEDDMERVAKSYVNAARMAKRAGFDTILLHYAHGWLMGGFLSNLINHRTDQYGGSIENRCRFPQMVLKRIRTEIPDLLVEIRLSGSELTSGGIELQDCVEMARIFSEDADMLHISCGTRLNAATRPVMHPSHFLEHGHNAFRAAAVKKAVSNIPVGVVGAITDPALAERILAEGMADYVLAARAFIADPDWGEKARRNKADEIRPCIKCLRCLDVAGGRTGTKSAVLQDFTNATKHNGCSVNPEYARQEVLSLYPAAAASRNVVVVGGGPAGMQAAMQASARGHRVTLLEKGDRLGGQLFYSDYVWFKKDMKNYRDWLIRMVLRSGTKVMLHTEASPELVKELRPDAVIVAVGADPFIPPIPGVEGANVHTALDIFADCSALGERVVLVGGGLVGCETALHLSRNHKQVTLLEMRDELAPDGYFSERLHTLEYMENDPNIECLTNTRCLGIESGYVKVSVPEGEKRIAADSVVLSSGMRARASIRDRFLGTEFDVIPVGDCVRPANLREATWQAYNAAMTIR